MGIVHTNAASQYSSRQQCKASRLPHAPHRVRVQTQYKQEHLGTLLTADTLYGTGELRDKSAVALIVPA